MEDVDTISDEFRVDVVRSKSNPVLEKRIVFKVYKRRWVILFVLCLLNCSNSIPFSRNIHPTPAWSSVASVTPLDLPIHSHQLTSAARSVSWIILFPHLWLTFAPVVDHSAQFLGVTLDQINWLSIIYMVVAIPLSFGTTWMLDTLGLRITLVLGSWLNTLGAVLRFVGILRSLPNAANSPVVMGGQTLCALAQPLVIFTPTKLAALWFPEHQRATANMIASMSNPLGILIASIFSPMIVGTTNNIPLLNHPPAMESAGETRMPGVVERVQEHSTMLASLGEAMDRVLQVIQRLERREPDPSRPAGQPDPATYTPAPRGIQISRPWEFDGTAALCQGFLLQLELYFSAPVLCPGVCLTHFCVNLYFADYSLLFCDLPSCA